jgi:hypothetical protein
MNKPERDEGKELREELRRTAEILIADSKKLIEQARQLKKRVQALARKPPK